MTLGLITYNLIIFLRICKAVPPEACFATFRSDDCGKPPVPVMYYWKPGSRCEVGLWRGCYPNLNMFQDEYECVATCIFSQRAGPDDYHKTEDIVNNTLEENDVPFETSSEEDITSNHTDLDSTGTTPTIGDTNSTTGVESATVVEGETTSAGTEGDKGETTTVAA